MSGYIDKIQEIAARLLSDGTVEMVLGFRQGSLPMMNTPFAARTVADVKELAWDSHCGINLANYLPNYLAGLKGRIGIIAKGCDSRNIVTHIIENKIKREQLFIIGVPCKGMVDKREVGRRFDGEILDITEDAGTLTVTGTGTAPQLTLSRSEMLQDNCLTCIHHNPVIHDELCAALVDEPKDVDRYADVRAIEALDSDAKSAHFAALLENCTRCYACRNACPLCYCPTCFVDESRPQWVGKGDDDVDTLTFHLLRAYHCAGRCTDCGACERACPMGIKMRTFTKKLEKDAFELFGWEAGLTVDERPPLDTYQPGDPDDFIE